MTAARAERTAAAVFAAVLAFVAVLVGCSAGTKRAAAVQAKSRDAAIVKACEAAEVTAEKLWSRKLQAIEERHTAEATRLKAQSAEAQATTQAALEASQWAAREALQAREEAEATAEAARVAERAQADA
eukprot:62116-Prymnesium_polylepis.1